MPPVRPAPQATLDQRTRRQGAGTQGASSSPQKIPNKKATLSGGFSSPADRLDQLGYGAKVLPGIELFLQGATPQLSSPQLRFTTEFEMDRCGSTAPWTPG